MSYPRQGSLGRQRLVPAVEDISFAIDTGETLALVGESGSGKSTTARAIVGLTKAVTGTVRFRDRDLLAARGHQLRGLRRYVQMVFQDPYSSLDPSWRVIELVSEPLRAHRAMSASQREHRVIDVLEQVGLGAEHLDRYPHEFSGGQRQRIAIARALAVEPELIILDEPVSALDVPTQNQIVNLLERLRGELGTTYLVIAHDLALVRHIADRVAVMYRGRLVEIGSVDDVFRDPQHPYTIGLLAAAPVPDPVAQRQRRAHILHGEIGDSTNRPGGCVFIGRCPVAQPVCAGARPELTEREPSHLAACHVTVERSGVAHDRHAE